MSLRALTTFTKPNQKLIYRTLRGNALSTTLRPSLDRFLHVERINDVSNEESQRSNEAARARMSKEERQGKGYGYQDFDSPMDIAMADAMTQQKSEEDFVKEKKALGSESSIEDATGSTTSFQSQADLGFRVKLPGSQDLDSGKVQDHFYLKSFAEKRQSGVDVERIEVSDGEMAVTQAAMVGAAVFGTENANVEKDGVMEPEASRSGSSILEAQKSETPKFQGGKAGAEKAGISTPEASKAGSSKSGASKVEAWNIKTPEDEAEAAENESKATRKQAQKARHQAVKAEVKKSKIERRSAKLEARRVARAAKEEARENAKSRVAEAMSAQDEVFYTPIEIKTADLEPDSETRTNKITSGTGLSSAEAVSRVRAAETQVQTAEAQVQPTDNDETITLPTTNQTRSKAVEQAKARVREKLRLLSRPQPEDMSTPNELLEYATTPVPTPLSYFLPYSHQHKIILHLQTMLEKSCFDYLSRELGILETFPSDTIECAEALELNRYIGILIQNQDIFSDEHIHALPSSLHNIFSSMTFLRHVAVHRNRITVHKLEQLLSDAEAFSTLLNDTSGLIVLARLRKELERMIRGLEGNKRVLEGRLLGTLKRLTEQRKELERIERKAVSDMVRDDGEFRRRAGRELELALEDPLPEVRVGWWTWVKRVFSRS